MHRIVLCSLFSNTIDDYILYYLKNLSYVSDIIITISDKNSEIDVKKLSSINVKHIKNCKNNNTFYAWKTGIEYINKNFIHYDELILCDSSCYGPLYPLHDIFYKMSQKECDFWKIIQYLP